MIRQVLIVIVSIAIIVLSTQKYDEQFLKDIVIQHSQPLLIPSANSLKAMTAGAHPTGADMYWLAAVQYTGLHVLSKDLPGLSSYIELITDINPGFEYAYEFTTAVLAEYNTEDAKRIGQKGMKNVPSNMEIPYITAFNEYYYAQDPESALGIIDTLPKTTKKLQALKGAILRNLGRHETARVFWISELSRANPRQYKYIQERIIREEGYIILNRAKEEYEKLTGKVPHQIADIIAEEDIPKTGNNGTEFQIQDGEIVITGKKKEESKKSRRK